MTDEKLKAKLLIKRIVTSTDCWLYTGAKVDGGYGVIMNEGRHWIVSRLSMFLFKPDEYRESLQANHTCDHPSCFNPAHLYMGTQVDNMKDMLERGNNFEACQTHCPKGHEYTVENTYTTNGRNCKTCSRERSRNPYLINSSKKFFAELDRYLTRK